jgi:hypothetical protein
VIERGGMPAAPVRFPEPPKAVQVQLIAVTVDDDLRPKTLLGRATLMAGWSEQGHF